MEKCPSTRPTPLHVRSVGSFLLNRTSTIGTCSSSPWIEAAVGNFPSRWTITTRCSQAEVVVLRPEANCANSFINSSVITQFENPRVFSEGKSEGSGNKAEKRWDISVPHSMVSVSRAGRDDGWNTTDGSLCSRRSSLTSVRGSTRSSTNGVTTDGDL